MSRVPAHGVELEVLEAGPSGGPLALCLHGFPDTARTWRHLAPALAAAGWHVACPYLRGYAPSGLPVDGNYQVGSLALDANALHEQLGGGEDAVLVGHDWGALAAYPAAVLAPERWRRVVALGVPHVLPLSAAFTGYDQLRRSWYMFLACTSLAEDLVAAGDFELLRRLWLDWSPGFDPDPELPAVRRALGHPRNLSAALGYYRAYFGTIPAHPGLGEAQAAAWQPLGQPTLYLHGRDDGCVGVECVAGQADVLGPGSRVEVLDGVGHFPHLEDPGRVNAMVLDFLGP